jgi:hypothetical protein
MSQPLKPLFQNALQKCPVEKSLANNNPVKFGISEAWDHLQAKSTRLLG